MSFESKLGFTEFKFELWRSQYYHLLLIVIETLYLRIEMQLKANDNIKGAFQK